MHLCNFQIFPLSITSDGDWTKTFLLIVLPCRKAQVISMECKSHNIMEIRTKTIIRVWQLHIGESVLLFILFSSNHCATNWAFNILLPFSFCFSVKTHLHETLCWPWSSTQLNTLFSFKLFNFLSLASKTSWLFSLTADSVNICSDSVSLHHKTSSQLRLLSSSPTISIFNQF